MKILHVMDMSHPMIKGYAIRARYLCEAQREFGHDTSVVTAPSQEEGRDEEGAHMEAAVEECPRRGQDAQKTSEGRAQHGRHQ